MKHILVAWTIYRTLVAPKDPVQANPLKGWNNAYHGTSRRGIICPTYALATEEGVFLDSRNHRNHEWSKGTPPTEDILS